MALVLVENQLSRPRSSVTLATTATRIAGVAATMLNSATIRIWRRAAARRRLPGEDQRRDLPADDQDEEEREAPVEDQDREDDRLGRRDRRQAHEDEEGPDGNRQRGHHRDIADGPHQAGELEAPSAERRD